MLHLLDLSDHASDLDSKLIDQLLAITPDKDINMRDENGRTFLHVAASNYGKNIILKILEKGGNIMAQNKKCCLPLQLSIQKRNSKFCLL
jgi:ankyrin repeat protein